MTFKIFIDESGDAGISNIREQGGYGSSPYFVLGATVVHKNTIPSALKRLEAFDAAIGKKWRHCTDLKHAQLVLLTRTLKPTKMRLFSVVSNKSTLQEYSTLIKRDPQKFYNKCAVYLLEKVARYIHLIGKADNEPEIVFEERNHDYDRLIRYLRKVRANPQYPESKFLKMINPFALSAVPKNKDKMLKFADLTAFATYQCFNKSSANYEIPEPRYLTEIQSKFGCDKNGKVLDYGIKCIHKLSDLEADRDVASKLREFRAETPAINS